MPLIQLVGILSLAGTVAAVALAVGGVALALLTKRPRLARRVAVGGGAVGVCYLLALASVSGASHEVILPEGEPKQFCGFYLDCHLSAAVIAVETAAQLGDPAHPIRARGRFWIVTVRLANDARREPLRFEGMRYRVRRPGGRWSVRVSAAETAIGSDPEGATATSFAPGESRTVRVVFDLPADVGAPVLSVKEGVPPDTGIEGLLLGDEDSAGHAPVLLALTPPRGA